MYAELEHAGVGEKTHLMRAFNRGWHAENTASKRQTMTVHDTRHAGRQQQFPLRIGPKRLPRNPADRALPDTKVRWPTWTVSGRGRATRRWHFMRGEPAEARCVTSVWPTTKSGSCQLCSQLLRGATQLKVGSIVSYRSASQPTEIGDIIVAPDGSLRNPAATRNLHPDNAT
jgi:hypothetical protein